MWTRLLLTQPSKMQEDHQGPNLQEGAEHQGLPLAIPPVGGDHDADGVLMHGGGVTPGNETLFP